MWKIPDFSVTQILREINFWESRSLKMAVNKERIYLLAWQQSVLYSLIFGKFSCHSDFTWNQLQWVWSDYIFWKISTRKNVNIQDFKMQFFFVKSFFFFVNLIIILYVQSYNQWNEVKCDMVIIGNCVYGPIGAIGEIYYFLAIICSKNID